jgi:DNA-directed RNA polymerase specialized sigma24 family protein
MKFRPETFSKNFADFKAGDRDGLTAILQSEKDRLFDYLMRMTGQVARSLDISEETIAVVEDHASEVETLEDLLVLIYKTGRNFSQDIWNADTSKLENSSYNLQSSKDQLPLVQLEVVLRSIPPEQKEIILLRERYGFALDEVAEISVTSSLEVESLFAKCLGQIEAQLPEYAENVPGFFCRLHLFPRPSADGHQTQNLSHLMSDFRRTSAMADTRGVWVWRVIWLGVFLVIYNYRLEIVTQIHSLSADYLQLETGQSEP